MSYEKLSTIDSSISLEALLEENDNNEIHKFASHIEILKKYSDVNKQLGNNWIKGDDINDVIIRNDKPFPISRPPPKHRDWIYALIFLLHFGGILLLSLIEKNSLKDSLLNYGRASSWSSMLMIITLLGSFFGALLSFIIGMQSIRDTLMSLCISFSIIFKILFGNILLILRAKGSQYSFLGIILIISALIDTFWYKSAKDNVSFTSTLIQVVIDITKIYGNSFFLLCVTIIFTQTCILLWWGAFFIGLVSTIPAGYVEPFIIILLLSLFWITQFFHTLVSFIVGGCVLWTFEMIPPNYNSSSNCIEEQDSTHPGDTEVTIVVDNPGHKLFLYVQCALTTSLGSICKGALFFPLAQTVLTLNHWVTRRPQQYISMCSLRGITSCLLTTSVLTFAQRNHRLSFCLMALYGRALGPTAMEHIDTHPETIAICIEDCTYFLMNSVAVVIAIIITVIFALFAEKGDGGSSFPLFVFICYYLAYCGISLTIHIYSSAVDALIVASVIHPERFAQEHQIIFLRFLRTSETALR